MDARVKNGLARVRFAPSPTGYLHIGGLRAALFNWLFARSQGGTFLVRIEDTDLQRSKQEYTQEIINSLQWVNITSDEPLIFQSQRLPFYAALVDQLLAQKKVYRCYCVEEEKEARCQITLPDGSTYSKYDRYCYLNNVERSGPFVIRFKLPDDVKEVVVDDRIRGHVVFPLDYFDDFIIVRSDGQPVYNFVVVVDDHAMGITDVIRGEEHLSNTPKQILLYQALHYALPSFAHLPLILNKSGGKLSKRDGATAVLEYKKQGYLPQALLNYLVRLGWSHGDQEIFTAQELILLFSLDAIGKKGSIFDVEKLAWVNSIYLKTMTSVEILNAIHLIQPTFCVDLHRWSESTIVRLIDLYKSRSKTLCDIIDEIKLLYGGPSSFGHDIIWNSSAVEVVTYLKAVIDVLSSSEEAEISDKIKQISQVHSCKLLDIIHPIRIALVGKSSGPGVFDLITLLGVSESIARLHNLMVYLNK